MDSFIAQPQANALFNDIREILQTAGSKTSTAINSAMVNAYWQIGQIIVEYEQDGAERAKYGKKQLEQLSKRPSSEFGKGFDVRNLRNMRAFYKSFPNRNALRTELSWTHYRSLHRIKSLDSRQLFASKYLPFLPGEEELRIELKRVRKLFLEGE